MGLSGKTRIHILPPRLIFLLIALAFPVHAETVEELKAQLEAKEQLIQLQRQRIDTLEAQIEGRKI